MPHLTGLMIPPDGFPFQFSFRVGKSQIPDATQRLLQSSEQPLVNSCNIGVLISASSSTDEKSVRNELATTLRRSFSTKLPEGWEIRGLCILLGEDEKGNTVSVSPDSVKHVSDLYHQQTGKNMPIRKTKRQTTDAPNKAKRDFDYFNKSFQEVRRAELKSKGLVQQLGAIVAEARSAWLAMNQEEQAPFKAKAAEDKARYDREMAEYLKTHPVRPQNGRNAYYFFNKANPDKAKRPNWQDMKDEDKKPFEEQAALDKVRFEADVEVYKKYCQDKGFNFDEMMASKKRKKAPSTTPVVEKKKKGASKKKAEVETGAEKASAPKKRAKKAKKDKAEPSTEKPSPSKKKAKKEVVVVVKKEEVEDEGEDEEQEDEEDGSDE